MSITYTKEQRQVAKDRGLFLATIAIPGYEFQGPVDSDQHKKIEEFLTQFLKDRREKLKASGK